LPKKGKGKAAEAAIIIYEPNAAKLCSVCANLTRIPANYLIHDLVTGHFVTVLRFVSPKLARIGISEPQFYAWLAEEIRSYQAANPELKQRFALFDLFKPEIEKICVNRVRFKIAYGDSDQRPLPEIGEPIANPLCSKLMLI
jgi:aerobactin synthase